MAPETLRLDALARLLRDVLARLLRLDALARLLRERPYHVALAAAALGLAIAEAPAALVAVLAAALAAGLTAARAQGVAPVAAAVLAGAAALGAIRLDALDGPGTRVRAGAHARITAHLLTAPRSGPFGASAEVAVTGGRLGGARLLARFPHWAPLSDSVAPGAELELRGRLEALGTDDFAAYLRRRAVAAELLVERASPTGRRRGGLAGLLDRMRARAERAVGAGLEPDHAALLRGMVLGQDERISAAVRDDFRASGLAHLLAVSGQNVMLLAALALPLLVLAGVGVRTRLLVLAGLIAVYVPLAGAGPSLQRAGIMGLAGLAAMASSRPASRWYALLLAATLTLAWNPRAWGDPGWQLSFAAVAGILLLGVPLGRALARAAAELLPSPPGSARRGALRLLADGLAITIAATVATAPLLAHHFGSVSTASLPANLLALPAVAPVMWLGMLKAALGQFAAFGPLPGVLAEWLGTCAALPAGYIALLAERFAGLPGAQVPLPLGSRAAVGVAYGALALVALATARAARRVAPGALEYAARWRRAPPRTRLVAAALAAALVLATAAALMPRAAPGQLTVRFLDVGQGDATLVQHPTAGAVLFDAGPPEAGVVRLLRRAGVKSLALVVATHASRDHHGGLADVLRSFPVAALLDGGDGSRDPAYRAVLAAAAERGVRRIAAVAPLRLALGRGLTLELLSPPPRPRGPPPEDPNPRAVVAVLSAGGFDLLLSGDAESDALLPLDLPDVNAMKVPHHGSADPGLADVLETADPELAAIEVGPNTYGHPTPSTLAALRHAGVRTYRTDRHGSVTLTISGGEISVETER